MGGGLALAAAASDGSAPRRVTSSVSVSRLFSVPLTRFGMPRPGSNSVADKSVVARGGGAGEADGSPYHCRIAKGWASTFLMPVLGSPRGTALHELRDERGDIIRLRDLVPHHAVGLGAPHDGGVVGASEDGSGVLFPNFVFATESVGST